MRCVTPDMCSGSSAVPTRNSSAALTRPGTSAWKTGTPPRFQRFGAGRVAVLIKAGTLLHHGVNQPLLYAHAPMVETAVTMRLGSPKAQIRICAGVAQLG